MSAPTATPTTAPTVRTLTTREAESLIEAAVRAAEGLGVRGSVTVLDAGGQLLGFRRDDSAVLISGETSTRKAYTALQLDAPTADLVDLVRPDGLFHTLPTALDRPLLFLAGGVPLHRDCRLIGALGFGGGAPEQDHRIVTAAIAEADLA
ncbi:heme-binding protein [Streptomyces sp. RPA4-5]|uniref:GlcG/HbpS family heme-binding protein n=1 Tax=Streptomyces sp. RPA4-5 TaxID=2721245 RepID=UPI00143E1535|nr:heme-binding protein [Streptomyces sp. RPA4-5]QIY56544.1 heme-binding protein [Streptomyces sp. RPA4-5]